MSSNAGMYTFVYVQADILYSKSLTVEAIPGASLFLIPE